MKKKELEKDLISLEHDLASILQMTEEEVMEKWNVDCKADIIEVVEEEIMATKEAIDEILDEDAVSFDRLDPAFQSWEQVNLMFV